MSRAIVTTNAQKHLISHLVQHNRPLALGHITPHGRCLAVNRCDNLCRGRAIAVAMRLFPVELCSVA